MEDKNIIIQDLLPNDRNKKSSNSHKATDDAFEKKLSEVNDLINKAFDLEGMLDSDQAKEEAGAIKDKSPHFVKTQLEIEMNKQDSGKKQSEDRANTKTRLTGNVRELMRRGLVD